MVYAIDVPLTNRKTWIRNRKERKNETKRLRRKGIMLESLTISEIVMKLWADRRDRI